MIHRKTLLLAGALLSACMPVAGWADATAETDYFRARWDPIHFQPAISKATDEQCLACHQEVLERKPVAQSPAGLKAANALAWYQTLDTYEGEQLTFHARHLLSDYAGRVMDLSCTTCHQGNDPRDETSGTSATAQQGLTMRKMVDPWVCVMCHGQFNAQKMGIPGPWLENSSVFGDSCLTCHAAIKTERHKDIAFLKADAIEEAGKKSADACYGCHGGRAWYRINFPYADRQWPGWGQPPAGAASKYPRKDPSQAAK